MTSDPFEAIERDERAMEKLALAMNRIADAIAKIAGLQEKRFQKDFPVAKPKRPAVIERPGDEKEKQYSDRADSEWVAETEKVASRFQQRFDETPEAEPKP